jgi:hypothetical protein
MNEKLSLLAKRRHLLINQITAQRQNLGVQVSPWLTRLAMAEKGLAAVRYVRNNPALWIGGVVLYGLFRKRGTGWIQGGLATFQLLRKAYRLMPKQQIKQRRIYK